MITISDLIRYILVHDKAIMNVYSVNNLRGILCKYCRLVT